MGETIKRKMVLTFFDLRHGYNGDDFSQNWRSVHIHYTLRGQTKRRVWQARFVQEMFLDKKLLSRIIWHQFKLDLNIVG